MTIKVGTVTQIKKGTSKAGKAYQVCEVSVGAAKYTVFARNVGDFDSMFEGQRQAIEEVESNGKTYTNLVALPLGCLVTAKFSDLCLVEDSERCLGAASVATDLESLAHLIKQMPATFTTFEGGRQYAIKWMESSASTPSADIPF
jgi:hypothetical protein